MCSICPCAASVIRKEGCLITRYSCKVAGGHSNQIQKIHHRGVMGHKYQAKGLNSFLFDRTYLCNEHRCSSGTGNARP